MEIYNNLETKASKEFKELLNSQLSKNKLISTEFIEEDIIVDVKYGNGGPERMMLIDSGAPKSIVSKKWLEGYLKNVKKSISDCQTNRLTDRQAGRNQT